MDYRLKEWFILINGKEEGPYSLLNLRYDRRITPETLVRKAGEHTWKPIGKIKELRPIFEDEEEININPKKLESQRDESVITLENDPLPNLFFIIIILMIVLFWLVYQIALKR